MTYAYLPWLAQLQLKEILPPSPKCTYSSPEPGCLRLLGSAVTINMNGLYADADGNLPFEADLYIAVCAFFFLLCARFGALWVTCAGRWEHFHQT